MKKVFGLLALVTSVALTACGGSSESSSYTEIKTLTNGNKYTCSSESAMKSCTNDETCAASCKLTYEAVKKKPKPDEDGNSCSIDANKNVSVTAKGCTYTSSSFNAGQTLTYTCVDGRVNSKGGLNFNAKTIKDGEYTLKCAS